MQQLVVDHEDASRWTLRALRGQNDDKTTVRSYSSQLTSLTNFKANKLNKSLLEAKDDIVSIKSPEDLKNPLKVNISLLNRDKGKKGISNKSDYFHLDENLQNCVKKSQMDYPSYNDAKAKYDRFC